MTAEPQSAEDWAAYQRRWRAAHPNKVKQIAARSYVKNRAKIIARVMAYSARPENKARRTNNAISRAKNIAARLGVRIEIPDRSPPELCECCGEKSRTRRSLHLDHCHDTGRFRGWCCHHCNTGQTAAKGVQGAKLWLAYLERPWQSGSSIKWAYPRKGRGSRAIAA